MKKTPPGVMICLVTACALWASVALGAPAPAQPKSYSIPVVDLSRETDRQIVVDREPGQYLGHPTTVLLEDDRTMLGRLPQGPWPRGHRDEAQHRRRADLVRPTAHARELGQSKETPTIYRVVDAEGHKRLILFSGLVSDTDGRL